MISNPISVVICGNIRNEMDTILLINKLYYLKKQKFITQIILSTWEKEIDETDSIYEIIEKTGTILIESPILNPDLGTYSDLNYCRQIRQLDAGLEVVSKDNFVIKCRTDATLSMVNKLVKTIIDLKDEDFQITERNIFNCDFCYKIWVNQLSISPMFALQDMIYFGNCNDLMRLVSYESYPLYANTNYWADLIPFTNPFINRFTFLKEFFNRYNYNEFNKLTTYISSIKDNNAELPTAYIKIISFYLCVLDSCFIHYDGTYNDKLCPTLCDILIQGFNNQYVGSSWIKYIRDSRYLNKAINAINEYPVQKNIQKYILSFKSNVNDPSNTIKMEESLDFGEWAKEYSSSQIIKSYPTTIIQKNTLYGDFPDYILNQYYRKYDLNFNQNQLDSILNSEDYYIQMLSISKELGNSQLSEIFEITSSRTLRSNICLLVAYKLFYNQYITKYKGAAEYVFKRYGLQVSQLMNMPCSSDILIANYYYSKYSEKTNPRYSETFISSITAYYDINANINNIDELIQFLMNTSIQDDCTKRSLLNRDLISLLLMVLPEELLQNYYHKLLDMGLNNTLKYIFEKYCFNESNNRLIRSDVSKNWLQISKDPYGKYCPTNALECLEIIDNSDDSQILSNCFNILYSEKCVDARRFGYVARMYKKGQGIEKNIPEAIKWYKKAIKINATWTKELVELLLKMDNPTLHKEAYNLCQKTHSLDSDIMEYLGIMYRDGKGVSKNLKKSAEWLRLSSESKKMWSSIKLIDVLWNINENQTDEEMYNICNALSSSNEASVLGRLARMYRDGRGVPKDTMRAIDNYAMAIKKSKQPIGRVIWTKELISLLNQISSHHYMKTILDYQSAIMFLDEESKNRICLTISGESKKRQ